jgi:MerR family redox-sensitive transcriptional activator SoxR
MDERGFTVGELAARSGVAASALRFYESRGLIHARRTAGNQRRFAPAELRRVSVIKAAQAVGLTLEEVAEALETLGERRAPTRADWRRLSRSWRSLLEGRIEALGRLRDDLDGCIGCGCLSLKVCALFNPEDAAGDEGPGPRFLLC